MRGATSPLQETAAATGPALDAWATGGAAALLLGSLGAAVVALPPEGSHRLVLGVGLVSLSGIAGLSGLALALRARRARLARAAAARREEAAVQARVEAGLRRILAGLPAVVYRGELFPDGSLRLDFVSDAAGKLLGLPPDAALGDGAWDRLFQMDRGAVMAFRRRLLVNGEASVEHAALRPDGSGLWLHEQARITGTGRDGQAAVLGLVQDVSAERAMREQAATASKLATLGTMAASIAHELAQPVSVMLFAAQAAEEALDQGASDQGAPDLVATLRQRLRSIVDQANRTRGLVDHLRVFGRAEAGLPEGVDLELVVEGALGLIGSDLANAGILLRRDLPGDLPPVRGQQILLEQVVLNLLANARDAMARQPAETRQLRIEARRAGERVVLAVQDSGPGFPPGVADRIFEPFFTTKASGAGTGLGLALCNSIIRSLDGTMAAVDTGAGARFTIDLPAWDEAAP
jgi:PAS domain S-box-containing protein